MVKGVACGLLGCDFTSRPGKHKPIVLARGGSDGSVVRLHDLLRFEALESFGDWLRHPGDWVGAFDLPFGLPRELVHAMGWPLAWEPCMRHYASLPRQEVRANDLTGPRRQYRTGGEADRRRAKRTGKRRLPQRLEQEFPAQRADRQVHEHRRQRQRQPFRPRPRNRGQYAPQIHVGQKQRDEREGDRQNDNGAGVGSHGS